MAQLGSMVLTVTLLTDDNGRSAAAIAAQVGIDRPCGLRRSLAACLAYRAAVTP